MHIADGVMAPLVWAIGWLLAIAILAFTVLKVNKTLDERAVPFMAILAAGIFVAQMLNFPIVGGTSGHLIGAALAAVLLGPWGAILVLSVILIIQALMFGDGGVTALGLNMLNMAIIGSLSAWAVLRVFPEKHRTAGIFSAAWLSVFLAGTVCGLELALSYAIDPTYGVQGIIALPAMMGTHAIIGLGEGIITAGVVAFLAKVAPETLNMRLHSKKEATAG